MQQNWFWEKFIAIQFHNKKQEKQNNSLTLQLKQLEKKNNSSSNKKHPKLVEGKKSQRSEQK